MPRKTTARPRARGQRTLADRPDAPKYIRGATGNPEVDGGFGPDGYQHPVPGDYIEKRVAPWPAVDRYPLRIGRNRSLAYFSTCLRLANIGYRMQLVDLLGELLEQDPHAYGVVAKRVMGVARGEIIFSPAKLEEGASETDTKLAAKIATEVEARFRRIPRLRTELVKLAWACYYGIGASEMLWRHGSDWSVYGLSQVHSRRLALPEWSQWRLFIWDQGPVSPWESFAYPTQAPLGLCIDELPGKFLVHCPPVRGDYPTREGLGIELGYWMLIKHIAARGAPSYLERFSNPLPEMIWSTGKDPKTGEIKAADRRDIAAVKGLLSAMAGGRVEQVSHPDTVVLQYMGSGTTGSGKHPIRYSEWIAVCDEQISVGVNGGTLTTKQGGVEGGGGGSRANGDTQRKDQISTWGVDADALGECLREGYVKTDVRLNYPGVDLERFCPLVEVSLEEDPDPTVIAERASTLANAGYPVDARKLEPMVGIPLADHKDPESIVMVPIKPQDLTPPIRPSDPDEQAENVAKAQATKANPPPPMQKIDPNTGKTIQAPTPIRAVPGGKTPPKPVAP